MDPILLWNEVALEANRVSHTNGKGEQTGPTLSSRALAIVHLAMYDAYAGVAKDPNLQPYISDLPSPDAGASAEAAVAAAAYKTLSSLFPSQKPFFDSILDSIRAGAGDGFKEGHDFGMKVAEAILADRKDDPGAGACDYKPSPQRGKHRPDPDNPGQSFHAPFYGAKSKGFAITKRHKLAEPPFDDNEYRRALREVRVKGIAPELMGTLPENIDDQKRSTDETLIGIFWAYDGAAELGTPPRLYNQIVRRVAIAQGNTPAKNALLFALVNAAMGDAGILAWEQKYVHNFWRPVVGIREHDQSMGPEPTEADNNIADNCDPLWLPLGAPNTNSRGKNFTPNFPAYPSGHATFGAAALHMTRLFYEISVGDKKPDNLFKDLDFVSEEFNGINTDNRGTVRPRHLRNFPEGLWQMIIENGRSRVDLGVHWIFDAFVVKEDGTPDLTRTEDGKEDGKPFGGVPLGIKIAEDIFQAGGGKGPKKPMPSS